MAVITQEQALKELEEFKREVQKKINHDYGEYNAKYEAWEKEKAKLAKEKSELEAQLDSLSAERQRMRTFAELDSGFRKLFEPIFKEIVREELRKSGGASVPSSGTGETGDLSLVKVKTEVSVEKEPRKVSYKDDTLKGRILTVIHDGESEKQWEPDDIYDEIEKRWGLLPSKLTAARDLKALVEEDKVVAKAPGRDKTHYRYFIPEGVELTK